MLYPRPKAYRPLDETELQAQRFRINILNIKYQILDTIIVDMGAD